MIKNIAKKSLLLALLAGIGFGATVAQAQERVYVIDQRDVVAKSGFDLCWRTGYWTPAAAAKDPAGCQCDKDLIPKEVCEPPAPAAPVAAPKPTGEKITVAADADGSEGIPDFAIEDVGEVEGVWRDSRIV